MDWKQIEVRMVKSSLVKNQMGKVNIQTRRPCGIEKIASSLGFSFLLFLKRGSE